jgi:hypothetical protein
MKQKLTIKISLCLLRKIFQMKISSVFIEKISNQMVQLLYVYLAINIFRSIKYLIKPINAKCWINSFTMSKNKSFLRFRFNYWKNLFRIYRYILIIKYMTMFYCIFILIVLNIKITVVCICCCKCGWILFNIDNCCRWFNIEPDKRFRCFHVVCNWFVLVFYESIYLGVYRAQDQTETLSLIHGLHMSDTWYFPSFLSSLFLLIVLKLVYVQIGKKEYYIIFFFQVRVTAQVGIIREMIGFLPYLFV